MTDIPEWFKSLPIFTRCWLSLTAGLSLLGRFGLIGAHNLILMFDPFIHKFQIWRPLTALFFYPLTPATGFHFLINCFFLYSYSVRLERDVFGDRPADYLFMLIFNWICCVIVGLLAEIHLLMDPMVLSVLYVWCQLNQDVIVNFWFGSQFKAMYLPWVLFAFNLVISGGGVLELVGILIGHLYFFLMFKFPQEMGGPQLLKTPTILYYWFPNQRTVHGFGSVPAARGGFNQPTPGVDEGGPRRHTWGRGQVLGRNN
ncbi:derlin 1 [Lycorma delicatula]|uniref:derlin 1 n=1 Tax=Lycorma delicatula TaxID=130591 RepID=UPI003F50DC1D